MKEYIHLRSLNSVSFLFFFSSPKSSSPITESRPAANDSFTIIFDFFFFYYFLLQLKDRGAITRLNISKRRERVAWRIDNRRFLLLGREEDSPEIDTFISAVSSAETRRSRTREFFVSVSYSCRLDNMKGIALQQEEKRRRKNSIKRQLTFVD